MPNRKSNDILMFLPGFLVYSIIVLIPILMTLYYSFHDWNGVGKNFSFIGIENYAELFSDREFYRTMSITLIMTVSATVLTNLFALIMAVTLNKEGRIINFYRTVAFLPLVLSTVAVGFIWKGLLSYNNGLINLTLEKFGFDRIPFLGDPDMAIAVIIFIAVWQSTGFIFVLYLAGLKTIPTSLFDAARIDGASSWQKFNKITFPCLAPAFTTGIVFMFTGMMREYDRVAVLTYGGPAAKTETIAYKIIKVGFNANRFSYASSMAIFMLLLVGIVAVGLTYFLRKREENLV